MGLKDKYLTITEAARYLGVTRQTVARWVAEGKLTTESVGRAKLIDITQIHAFRSGTKMTGKIFVAMIGEALKRKYYGKDDKVEVLGDNYLVTKADGTMEMVEVNKFTVTVDDKDKSAVVELQKVVRKPYSKKGIKPTK